MKIKEDWIKPGASVISVEKKTNESEHPGAESDSENDDSEEDNVDVKKNEKKIIGPSQINETHNEQLKQKMDVDDNNISPTINNGLSKDATMEED